MPPSKCSTVCETISALSFSLHLLIIFSGVSTCLKTGYLHPASNCLFLSPDPSNSIVCADALLLSKLAKYTKPTKRACVAGARTHNTFQMRKIVCGSVVAAVSCTKNISASVFNAAHVRSCCNGPVLRSCAVCSSKPARFALV